jgi:putative RHS accessory genetic element
LMDDATGAQRLNLHAQYDMNTKVLNNRSTTVNGDHSETIIGNQSILVVKNRYKEIVDNETTNIQKNSKTTVGSAYQLLVQGDVIFESLESNLILETDGAKITLFNNGNIDIQGKEIQINGDTVHLNPIIKAEKFEKESE